MNDQPAPTFCQFDDPACRQVLYTPTQRVTSIASPDIQTLIDTMSARMRGVGIGLAANQIGSPLQIFMLQFSSDPGDPRAVARYRLMMPDVPFQVFINPRITAASPTTVSFWHGCLSALGHPRGLVATYEWLDYEAFDRDGQAIAGRLDKMGAVIFQHEFRHLLGRVYVDQTQTFADTQELTAKFTSGALQAYQPCGPEVPHLLSDYLVGETIEQYAQRIQSLGHKNDRST